MNPSDVAQICKALGDANRLQIMQILTQGEQCACQLLERFQITQPTLSHHMKVLSGCKAVNIRKEGKWSYYSVNCDTLTQFREFIGTLNCFDCSAEVEPGNGICEKTDCKK